MEYQLREWRMEDAVSCAQYADNRAIADNLRDAFPNPYTLEDAATYIQSCINTEPDKAWLYAIVINGKAAGSIGVFRGVDIYRLDGEIGYWLGEPYWKNGIMSRAIAEVCERVFSVSDLARIHAEPFAHNAASRRALEKAGFTLEGVLRQNVIKNGRMADSCIYALLRGE